MTFANNLDSDEAPQDVGPHLRSNLFDSHIIYQQTIWRETMYFNLPFLKKKNKSKNLFAMQRVRRETRALDKMRTM